MVGKPEQRASKGLSRLEDITRLISEWVWEADAEGRLTYASERVTEILGWIPIQIHGKTFFELGRFVDENGTESPPDLEKPFRELLFEAKTRTGDQRLLLLSGLPFYDKDTWSIEGYCGTAEDITDQRHALDEMRLAKREAEKANLAKSDFLSSMSHELRTPLNAIIGFGQMLEYNPKEPLTKSQKESVDLILKGGSHLLQLINDVLELAKIEAGKMELFIEDVPLSGIAKEALPLVSDMADRRNIRISMPDSTSYATTVRADFTRLKQVLLNLMSNAIKYNRDGGSVVVTFEQSEANMQRISVTDTGPGIPWDRQGELFTAFNRLDAANTEIEGTGIGLVICKDLVNLMGGSIGFESEVGKGSTFWFEVPLATAASEESSISDGAVDEAQAQLPDIYGTILYVEDNPSNLKLMETIVSRIKGLSILSAHTAELGIEVALSKQPDLIILDINLPGMSGIDALRKLKDFDETKDIPVIALSAAATKADIDKGIKAGFRQYLTKPIQVLEITEAIKSYVAL